MEAKQVWAGVHREVCSDGSYVDTDTRVVVAFVDDRYRAVVERYETDALGAARWPAVVNDTMRAEVLELAVCAVAEAMPRRAFGDPAP